MSSRTYVSCYYDPITHNSYTLSILYTFICFQTRYSYSRAQIMLIKRPPVISITRTATQKPPEPLTVGPASSCRSKQGHRQRPNTHLGTKQHVIPRRYTHHSTSTTLATASFPAHGDHRHKKALLPSSSLYSSSLTLPTINNSRLR